MVWIAAVGDSAAQKSVQSAMLIDNDEKVAMNA